MGSQALTVDRASFLRSSILSFSLSPSLSAAQIQAQQAVLTPDTHERRPAKQVTVVLEIKAMQLRGRQGNYSGNVFN